MSGSPPGFAPVGRAPDTLLAFLQELADRADEIALRHFRSASLRVERKGDGSPVTEADRAVEALVRRETRAHYPEFGILGEEEGAAAGSSESRLILDPIDGTKNFMRGIPIFATLLAVETAGEVVAGVVSAPALGCRWHAVRGGGAYRDHRRLRVSNVAAIRDAHLFHGGLKDANGTVLAPGWSALFASADRTRGFGDFYQHVLVAEGAGELAYDPRVKPWDIAPLVLLVEEAGGRATSVQGARSIESGNLITSNGGVHEEALAILARSDVEGGKES
ncbi:MAG: inositol monophosphatase family protein [Hyphomicrobiales bacterium]